MSPDRPGDEPRSSAAIAVGNAPRALVAGFGALWVASEADRTVARIDLERERSREDRPRREPDGARRRRRRGVGRERGGRHCVPDRAALGHGREHDRRRPRPGAVAVGDGAVWVANRQDATVSRIDRRPTRCTGTITVGRDPVAIAVGDGAVWVAADPTAPSRGSTQ